MPAFGFTMANNNSLLGNLSPISDNPGPKSIPRSPALWQAKQNFWKTALPCLAFPARAARVLISSGEERRAGASLTTEVVGLLIALYFSSNFSARGVLTKPMRVTIASAFLGGTARSNLKSSSCSPKAKTTWTALATCPPEAFS